MAAVNAESGSNVTVADGATVTGVVAAADGSTVKITGGSFAKAPTGGTFDEKPNVLHAEDLKGFKLDNGKYAVANAELAYANGADDQANVTLDIKNNPTVTEDILKN